MSRVPTRKVLSSSSLTCNLCNAIPTCALSMLSQNPRLKCDTRPPGPPSQTYLSLLSTCTQPNLYSFHPVSR
ncbi:hypothetical protein BJX64DRAFT_250533 [Aspergillus heterothallicus]